MPLPRADDGRGRGEEAKRLGAARRGYDARSIAKAPPDRKYIRYEYDRAVRAIGLVAGVLLILGGLVWIAQGLNLPFAPRSFMTADRTWIVLGAAAVMAGGVLVWRGRRSA